MSNRALLSSTLILFLAGLWACWCDVAMLWDGAYQFCCSVTAGRAFAYLSRFHSWVVWQPVIWLARSTENLRLLKMAYGAPFCFAPLASVLLCWWIAGRRAPHLMLWSLFGAAIAPLPGQIFMINDSIFQMHFFWPLFLATFLPLTRLQLVAILAVSLFQLSHPIGIGLCLLAACAALAGARWGAPARQRALTGWAAWQTALAIGGVVKLLLWPDAYAAREASPHQVWMTFRWGVLWWPAIGMSAAWAAAALLFWTRAQPGSARARQWGKAALPLLLVTAGCWVYWAFDPYTWQTAANYRRWLAPMSLPFFLAAGWELWHPTSPDSAPVRRDRSRAGVVLATIFAVVLGLQSCGWSRLLSRLSTEIAHWPTTWIKESDLPWTHDTPLDHWGLATQIMLVQGRTPRVLLWHPGDDLAARDEPARFGFSPFNYFAPAASPHSWFDWSTVLRESRTPGTEP